MRVGGFFLIYIGDQGAKPCRMPERHRGRQCYSIVFFLELMQLCQLYDSLGELWNDGFENRIANWVYF